MPNRKPVISSNVAGYYYDEDAQTLEIEFRNGSVYQYDKVPQAVADQFEQAQSKGTFVAKALKGTYFGSKIQ
jgi:hypothetical protein